MMKLLRNTGLGMALAATAVVFPGCEWETTGSDDSISQRYNWVSFSGVYRPATNGYLVAESTSGLDESGNTVVNETIGTGNGVQTLFTAVLDHRPVIAGTVSVSGAGFVLVDDGSGGLSGSGKTGTINYDTGAISVNLAPAAADAGAKISATYQYQPGSSGGSSGNAIFTFTVQQSGNAVTIVDNNGATYSGKISSIKTTGGVSGDEPSTGSPTPVNGDTVTASFEVEGRSSSGASVKIVGTFVGVAVVGSDSTTGTSTLRLSSREMHGTWIEASGQTGDIYGVAQ